MKDSAINFLAFFGALDCVIIPLLFAQGQSPLFPMPGLYFLELVIGGLFVMWMIQVRRYPLLPWAAGGVLLAFVVLGALSIGFYLTPALLAFTAAAVLWHGKPDRELLKAFSIFFGAAIAQAALMLFLVLVL